MSWLMDNLAPLGTMAAGAGLTAVGAGAVGVPLLLGGAGMYGQNQANAQNIKQADRATGRSQDMAREQMAFQERMSSSAFQRSQADMKKAGLNPIMSANSPSSSPSGASGSASMARVENSLGKGISSAIEMKNLMLQIQNQEATVALNRAMATKALQDTATSASSARSMEANTKAVESQLKAIAAKAKADEIQSGYNARFGAYDAIMNRANRDSGTAKNVFDFFRKAGPNTNIYRRGSEFRIDRDTGIFNKSTGEIYNP